MIYICNELIAAVTLCFWRNLIENCSSQNVEWKHIQLRKLSIEIEIELFESSAWKKYWINVRFVNVIMSGRHWSTIKLLNNNWIPFAVHRCHCNITHASLFTQLCMIEARVICVIFTRDAIVFLEKFNLFNAYSFDPSHWNKIKGRLELISIAIVRINWIETRLISSEIIHSCAI